ncbi:hypothetical protein MMC26_004189 [Xylographa opegraphella]|nr:hypothetical protein [Xylographa opegraphella]
MSHENNDTPSLVGAATNRESARGTAASWHIWLTRFRSSGALMRVLGLTSSNLGPQASEPPRPGGPSAGELVPRPLDGFRDAPVEVCVALSVLWPEAVLVGFVGGGWEAEGLPAFAELLRFLVAPRGLGEHLEEDAAEGPDVVRPRYGPTVGRAVGRASYICVPVAVGQAQVYTIG